MKTYFIRHKSDDLDMLAQLQGEKRIAIFYDGQPFDTVFNRKEHRVTDLFEQRRSAKATDYGNAYATALGYFDSLGREGGYVFAEYGKGAAVCFLGKVEPGTLIEPIDSVSPVTLKMCGVREVVYEDYPVLLAIRPPYGTICVPQRETYSTLAQVILENATFKPSTDLLHHQMAEQMCVEYLRHVGISGAKLAHCMIKPGKTVAMIDIAARMDDGSVLFAQVKNGGISAADARSFIEFLRPDSEKIGVIFHDAKVPLGGLPVHIKEVDIKDVFSHFVKSDPQLVSDMIGLESLRKSPTR